MDSLTVAIWALVIGLVGNAIAWFFKTPKESQSDLESAHSELEGRVKNNEMDHRNLERDFIRSSVALVTKVETLSGDVRDLTIAVRALTSRMDQNGFRHKQG